MDAVAASFLSQLKKIYLSWIHIKSMQIWTHA